jgi:hypothetical protein
VFVTGYGLESIDRRFANVDVLQKPVERDMLQRVFVAGGDLAVSRPGLRAGIELHPPAAKAAAS